MRLPCLFVVLPAVVVLAGCATPAPPRYAEALAQDLTQQPGLDALMYRAPQPASPAVRQVAQVMAPLEPYTLDAGDRLRIVVFGQDALSNSYIVGASGVIAVPLVGTIPARGLTTTQLAGAIAARLRRGFVRDPSVSVEVETYRPFFVLGEVTYPGQYPYVPNMTVESAVAIAGGFTPRALRNQAEVTRGIAGAPARLVLPLTERLRPGDTVTIGERWFWPGTRHSRILRCTPAVHWRRERAGFIRTFPTISASRKARRHPSQKTWRARCAPFVLLSCCWDLPRSFPPRLRLRRRNSRTARSSSSSASWRADRMTSSRGCFATG